MLDAVINIPEIEEEEVEAPVPTRKVLPNKFFDEEAELGSDNEEHDHIVRKADNDEIGAGEDLDADLPGLIDDQKVEEDRLEKD